MRFTLILLIFFGIPNYLLAQLRINGTVGEGSNCIPLPGVNVMEKGFNNGTITDFEGKFQLITSSGLPITIVVSYIGYPSIEVEVTNNTNLGNICLTNNPEPTKTITGRIGSDSLCTPLPLALITGVGTGEFTLSGFQGNFSLTVPLSVAQIFVTALNHQPATVNVINTYNNLQICLDKNQEDPGSPDPNPEPNPDPDPNPDPGPGGAQTPPDPEIIALSPHDCLLSRTYNAEPFDFKANSGPRVYQTSNCHFLYFSDNDTKIATIAKLDPSVAGQERALMTSFPINHQNQGMYSDYSFSLQKFKGKMILARTAQGKKINLFSNTYGPLYGGDWGDHIRFNEKTDEAPVLLTTQDTLFLAWKKHGNKKIFIRHSLDGLNWSSARDAGIRTKGQPALAYFKNRLFMAWRGDNRGHLFVQSSTNGGYTWENKVRLVQKSKNGPTLFTVKTSREDSLQGNFYEDRLYIVWSGNREGKINTQGSDDGLNWNAPIRRLDHRSNSTPWGFFDSGRYFLIWRIKGRNRFIFFSGPNKDNIKICMLDQL